MTPAFQITGLPHHLFSALFELSDEELAAQDAVRRIADSHPGYPCRVSLQDAAVGEELLLLPYEHHRVDSPYRSAGPIFVRRGAAQRRLPPGELPPCVTRRLISVRAYDGRGMMVDAAVHEGIELRSAIERLFANDPVAYLQLHNAKPGCFSCQVDRC